jgi:hypothetical protein
VIVAKVYPKPNLMLKLSLSQVRILQTLKKVCVFCVVSFVCTSCALIWEDNPLNWWNYVQVDPEKSFRLDKAVDTPQETWGKKFASFQKEVAELSPHGKTIPIIVDPEISSQIVPGWKAESLSEVKIGKTLPSLETLPAIDALRQVCAENSFDMTVMDNGILISKQDQR